MLKPMPQWLIEQLTIAFRIKDKDRIRGAWIAWNMVLEERAQNGKKG